MGKDHEEGFEAMKESDTNLVKNLEKSIQFGQWLLLENIGIDLDPVLDPILT